MHLTIEKEAKMFGNMCTMTDERLGADFWLPVALICPISVSFYLTVFLFAFLALGLGGSFRQGISVAGGYTSIVLYCAKVLVWSYGCNRRCDFSFGWYQVLRVVGLLVTFSVGFGLFHVLSLVFALPLKSPVEMAIVGSLANLVAYLVFPAD